MAKLKRMVWLTLIDSRQLILATALDQFLPDGIGSQCHAPSQEASAGVCNA